MPASRDDADPGPIQRTGDRLAVPPPRGLWRCIASVVTLATSLALPFSTHAVPVSFTLPAALTGTSARLEFALYDGDSDPNNTVTITNLATNGALGPIDCSSGCSPAGSPPAYVLDESLGFGLFLQDLTFGTSISFDLAFTTAFSGTGVPDRLILGLLDPSTNFTVVSTDLNKDSDDPVGYHDALLILDLKEDGLTLARSVVVPGSDPGAVAEPGTIATVLTGLGLLASARRRRGRERTSLQ